MGSIRSIVPVDKPKPKGLEVYFEASENQACKLESAKDKEAPKAEAIDVDVVTAPCAASPSADVCCMFAGPKDAYPFIEGTLCGVNSLYCPPSIYKKPEVFSTCPVRKQKLRERA